MFDRGSDGVEGGGVGVSGAACFDYFVSEMCVCLIDGITLDEGVVCRSFEF